MALIDHTNWSDRHPVKASLLGVLLIVPLAWWYTDCRSRRQDGDRMVSLSYSVGPTYYIDLELNVCFASYGGGLIQLDADTCHKLRMKHTDIGELPGEVIEATE